MTLIIHRYCYVTIINELMINEASLHRVLYKNEWQNYHVAKLNATRNETDQHLFDAFESCAFSHHIIHTFSPAVRRQISFPLAIQQIVKFINYCDRVNAILYSVARLAAFFIAVFVLCTKCTAR